MWHLVKRFIGHVTASPLSPAEQAEVAAHLESRLRPLFFAQAPSDQRHAYEVAVRAGLGEPHTEAALLHDVGKTVSGLGPVARSLATIWSLTGLPVWGRWQAYLDHGPIGARMLFESGADRLAIEFAGSHPGPVPSGIDPGVWDILAAADHI